MAPVTYRHDPLERPVTRSAAEGGMMRVGFYYGLREPFTLLGHIELDDGWCGRTVKVDTPTAMNQIHMSAQAGVVVDW